MADEQPPQQPPPQQTRSRISPLNDLDLVLMTTDAVWGKYDVSPGLKQKLTKITAYKDSEGKVSYDYDSLWDLLGFYTRDMRLANLSTWDGELIYTRYFLDLANDFLQAEMIEPFLICISRVATVLETSQSKGGFLRRRINTFTQESFNRNEEPPKKNLFGIGKKKDGER